MRKSRTLRIIIPLCATLIACGLIFVFTELPGSRFNKLVIDENTAQQLVSARTALDDAGADIYLNGEKLLFDGESETYYYSLVEDDKGAFNPKVTMSSDMGFDQIAFIDADINKELIASNRSISVLLYNDESYCRRSIVCTTLPVMDIRAGEEIGDTDIRMEVSLFDNRKEATGRTVTSDGFVRLRGNTTRIFPKKSFKLSLRNFSNNGKESKRDISLLGMRGDDDWVLTACYNDRDKVRNLFSHNLWTQSCGIDNSYGIQTGVNFRFIELFVNGHYQGLYIFGYRPDNKTLGVSKKSENVFYKRDYLLSGFDSDFDIKPIQDYYCKLEENAEDNDYLKRSIDLDNAIDFNLFVTLIQGSDNILKNYYVVLVDNDGEKAAVYVPWDLDRSWGDEWTPLEKNQTAYYKMGPDENMIFTDDALYQLLFNEDEETWNMLFDKYDELRNNGWSDKTISEMLDDYEDSIFASGAYLREKERWPEADYNDLNSLKELKDFVMNRLKSMDETMMELKLNRSGNPFIDQSLLHEGFEESLLFVEINADWVTKRDRYKEFLEYMGLDLSRIGSDTRYVITHFGGDDAEYIDDFGGDGNAFLTSFGLLELIDDENENYEYDEKYTVCLDGKKIYNTNWLSGDPIIVASLLDDRVRKMNMDEGYRVQFDLQYTRDPELILRLLDNMGGYIILQVNNLESSIINKERLLREFDLDLGSYASLEEAMADSEALVCLLDSDRRTGYLMEDPYVSGSVHDTELGQYAFYASETDYGIYINGFDAITGSLDSLYEYDLIITSWNQDFNIQFSRYAF